MYALLKKSSPKSFINSGLQSVYGDLSCQGFASNGSPYVTATEGFRIEDTSRVSAVCTFHNSIAF